MRIGDGLELSLRDWQAGNEVAHSRGDHWDDDSAEEADEAEALDLILPRGAPSGLAPPSSSSRYGCTAVVRVTVSEYPTGTGFRGQLYTHELGTLSRSNTMMGMEVIALHRACGDHHPVSDLDPRA